MVVQAGLGKSKSPYLKQPEQKAGGMAQAVEHLPSKCKALSSHSGTTKKKSSLFIIGNLMRNSLFNLLYDTNLDW
jgi:hypothetical protein